MTTSTEPKTPKISTFLWYAAGAEDAVKAYGALFPDLRVTHRMRGPGGKTMAVSFELGGQSYTAFDGGPAYALTPAVSIFVDCETQAEIDRLWDGLLAGGGKPTRCGWLVDAWGLSWQIIPTILPSLIYDADPAKRERAMKAMLAMQKLDIAALVAAHGG